MIGAIRLGKRPLLMTNEGAVNGRIFLRFVEQRLARGLDTVEMLRWALRRLRSVASKAGFEAPSPKPTIK